VTPSVEQAVGAEACGPNTLKVSVPDGLAPPAPAPGRRVNGVCEGPTAQNGKQPACFKHVAVHGALTKSASQGRNSFVFNGHIIGQTLAPGCYRLSATPNANGQTGAPQTTAFRIAAPPWPCQNSNLANKNTA
jgi:hypothetical protein